MPTTAVRRLLLGAVAALALTGCSTGHSTTHAAARSSASPSGSPTAGDTPSATPSGDASATPLLAVTMAPNQLGGKQKKVADVVLEYWKRYAVAVSTRDVPGSKLSKVVSTATGVSATKKVVDTLKSNGQRYRGSLTVNIRSVGFGGSTATVDACVDQSRTRLVDANGSSVKEPDKQGIMPIAHTLVRQHGSWLIDKLQQGGFTC